MRFVIRINLPSRFEFKPSIFKILLAKPDKTITQMNPNKQLLSR